MCWIYYTEVYPNNENNDYFQVLNAFVNNFLINEDKITKINKGEVYRFIVKTDDKNDKIFYKNKIFLKSIFLMNKEFKKRLISYYKCYGLYVKGPNEIKNRDGFKTNRWIIELTM